MRVPHYPKCMKCGGVIVKIQELSTKRGTRWLLVCINGHRYSVKGENPMGRSKKNPLVNVDKLAIEAKKKYREDIKAGHGKGEEYWAGYAGAAYLMSNPVVIEDYEGLQVPYDTETGQYKLSGVVKRRHYARVAKEKGPKWLMLGLVALGAYLLIRPVKV